MIFSVCVQVFSWRHQWTAIVPQLVVEAHSRAGVTNPCCSTPGRCAINQIFASVEGRYGEENILGSNRTANCWRSQCRRISWRCDCLVETSREVFHCSWTSAHLGRQKRDLCFWVSLGRRFEAVSCLPQCKWSRIKPNKAAMCHSECFWFHMSYLTDLIQNSFGVKSAWALTLGADFFLCLSKIGKRPSGCQR